MLTWFHSLAEGAWVEPLTLPNRPLLPAGEREDEWGPELIRPWLSMPSWYPETETTTSCWDFWNNRLSTPALLWGRERCTYPQPKQFPLSLGSPSRGLLPLLLPPVDGGQDGRGGLPTPSSALLFEDCCWCGAGADAVGRPRRRAGWALQLVDGWSSSCPPRQEILDRLTLPLCSPELLGHVTGCVAEEASLGYRNLEEPNFVGVPMSTRHNQRWRSWTTSVDIARPRDRAITFVARGARSGAVQSSFRTSGSWPPPCMSLSAFSLKNLQ